MDEIYSIVEFSEEKTVEVIPTSWLTEDKLFCFWSNYSSLLSISKAIRKHELHNIILWKKIAMRILGSAGNSLTYYYYIYIYIYLRLLNSAIKLLYACYRPISKGS